MCYGCYGVMDALSKGLARLLALQRRMYAALLARLAGGLCGLGSRLAPSRTCTSTHRSKTCGWRVVRISEMHVSINS